MNNYMLDGNTAALNAYELEEEQRLLAAEIDQDDIDMRVEDLVVASIKSSSAESLEAIGTEATLSSSVELDPKFKAILLESITCKGCKSQDDADKDLGKIVRELVTAYIVGDLI